VLDVDVQHRAPDGRDRDRRRRRPGPGPAVRCGPAAEPVDIDVIAELSRALDAALVADGVVSEDATLEVSSPGVERPLVTPRTWCATSVATSSSMLVDEDAEGRLVAVEDGRVGIVVGWSRAQVALEQVAAARLVLPW
jgi:ribosome maturation factor RimP